MSDLHGPGPRVLLRRLREAMARGGSPQERLNRCVTIIASNMVAEVCSIYLSHPGDMLELAATEGLNQAAVGKTRLRIGEGLVGLIAAERKPLVLTDAPNHPAFAYRPETGEDPYHSLAGVPIIHSELLLGVLIVQNRTQRQYPEEEVEALETVAMFLAEVAQSAQLVNISDLASSATFSQPQHFEGLILSVGIAIGRIVLHEPQIEIDHVLSENIEIERARMTAALTDLRSSIDEMLSVAKAHGRQEYQDILETYRMFASDKGWRAKLDEALTTGLTAEAAAKKVQNETRQKMQAVADPYIRERLADLEDLSNRLLRLLVGKPDTAAGGELPENTIVAARHMGPADLMDYDREKLKGVVLEEGSPNAHVAIVARALGIPMIGNVPGVLSYLRAGDPVILDADSAQLYVRPDQDVMDLMVGNIEGRTARHALLYSQRSLPSVSYDGVEVSLKLNAGLTADLQQLELINADGVGLFRTELEFMVRSAFPDVAAQAELYRRVFERVGTKRVVFRTLDIGGDKGLPYFRQAREENPAMGWRAIRIGLDRPNLLRRQLKALAIAAGEATHDLDVMFPMIANVAEFDAARQILFQQLDVIKAEGRPLPTEVRVGAMFEVPSLWWQMDVLFERCDFLSIGSNDLMQFFFACDRGNPTVARRYDILSPPALKFLRDLAKAGEDYKKPITICGEMAGRPLEGVVLAAIGFRSLSMAARAVGPVKAMIRKTELNELAAFVDSRLDSTAASLRDVLRFWLVDHLGARLKLLDQQLIDNPTDEDLRQRTELVHWLKSEV